MRKSVGDGAFNTCAVEEGSAGDLSITGSFFAQQNGLTGVCAHAALRTIINNSPKHIVPKLNGRKLTNKMINDVPGISFFSPQRRRQRQRGLYLAEMNKVVAHYGGFFHGINFLENISVEYDQFIYPLIESSCPVILCLEGMSVRPHQPVKPVMHAVAVLGHSINSDRWVEARQGYGNFPIKPYFSSAEWCDHFVISDDNYGMYVTLPSDMVRNFVVPSKNPRLHAFAALAITPQGVSLQGYKAEQAAVNFAKSFISMTMDRIHVPGSPKPTSSAFAWFQRLRGDNIVCRTLVVTNELYLEHLNEIERDIGQGISEEIEKYIRSSFSQYVWVSEISLPDIYNGNKGKLGDVVVRADANPEDIRSGHAVVFAWFPGLARLGLSGPTKPWFIEKYVPFIRKTECSQLEW